MLGGLIRADIVTAIASSYKNATQAFSEAEGSGLTGLVVNGVSLVADPAPNTYKASAVKRAQFHNAGWGGPVLSGSRPPVL